MPLEVKHSFLISINDWLSAWPYSPFIFHSFPQTALNVTALGSMLKYDS